MTEKTTSVPTPQEAPRANNAGEIIRRVTQHIQEMTGVLMAQRELLAQRGLELPMEPVSRLQKVATDLRGMMNLADDRFVELAQLRELSRTAEIINSQLRLEDVLNEVIDSVIALTGSERGYVVLHDPETGEFGVRLARKMNQNDVQAHELVVSQTIVKRVAEQGEPILTINAQEDPRFQGSASIADYALRSILCVPLKHKGVVIGVIYVDNRMQHGVFTEREQRLVYAFANQAAIAIQNARLFDQVRAALAEIGAIKDYMDNVFASIASGVITTDQADVVMILNQAASEILGIPSAESVGQELWKVLPPLYDGFHELVADVRDHNRSQVIEVEPILPHRGQVTLNLKLSPFRDAAETTQGVAVVLDDLTALKQQQATLSVVKGYLPTAMLDKITEIDGLALSGVEREISVLFCDVRGFTAFSETLPPETLMQVINRYLTVASNAINDYTGVIDKYMGDAVVGLYNTQLNSMTDHAYRAVCSALKIVADINALHFLLPPEQRLKYGIGVHTGMAILGNVGSPRRKEFTAIGNTIQVAKALQENALGGEVLISAETLAMLGNRVTAEPIQPRRPKEGEESPLSLYRVISLT
jgi:PAS domain S-box-containing protein